MRRLSTLFAAGVGGLFLADPAFAAPCASLQACAQGSTPLAGVIGIGLASLLGLVGLLALDGAFGLWTADEFAPDEAAPDAGTLSPPRFTTPPRAVEALPQTPLPEPEYGADRLFLRPPEPREANGRPGSLFRGDIELPPPDPKALEAAKEEKFSATASVRDAFDDKLDGLAKAYKPDDADYAKVSVTLDDDGAPTDGSINYFNRRFDNTLPIYKVTVDADGDPVGAASTAAGRAFQALEGFLPDGAYSVEASYGQDVHGGAYIERVRIMDENNVLRADLQFNEDGHAWLGERFDADGKRIGVLDNPDMAPGGGLRHAPPVEMTA